MPFRIIIVLVFVTCSSVPSFGEAETQRLPSSSAEIQARCSSEAKVECLGACFDGFGTDCYYDGGEFSSPPSFLKDRAKCFGYRHHSVCKPCANIFQIETKDVSCQEFYEKLRQKNQECQGCVQRIGAYGG